MMDEYKLTGGTEGHTTREIPESPVLLFLQENPQNDYDEYENGDDEDDVADVPVTKSAKRGGARPSVQAAKRSLGGQDNYRRQSRGKQKIRIEFMQDKNRRYSTFSKRKTGLMKKAYELAQLTGAEVLLLVASETSHVYTFATTKLKAMIDSERGMALIQTCLCASSSTQQPSKLDHHQLPPSLTVAPASTPSTPEPAAASTVPPPLITSSTAEPSAAAVPAPMYYILHSQSEQTTTPAQDEVPLQSCGGGGLLDPSALQHLTTTAFAPNSASTKTHPTSSSFADASWNTAASPAQMLVLNPPSVVPPNTVVLNNPPSNQPQTSTVSSPGTQIDINTLKQLLTYLQTQQTPSPTAQESSPGSQTLTLTPGNSLATPPGYMVATPESTSGAGGLATTSNFIYQLVPRGDGCETATPGGMVLNPQPTSFPVTTVSHMGGFYLAGDDQISSVTSSSSGGGGIDQPSSMVVMAATTAASSSSSQQLMTEAPPVTLTGAQPPSKKKSRLTN